MKIRMLGTGYGECKVKKKSSKDFRRKGGVIIDEKILVDAPCDIFDVAGELGFSDMFDNVYDVIISHSHAGHFSVDAITKLAAQRKINLYATAPVLSQIPDSEKISKTELFPFTPVNIGDYRVLPLPSNHKTDDTQEVCLNFTVSKDKTVFYALDGGLLNFGAWESLSEIKTDAAILDCALETKKISGESMFHNNIDGAKYIKDILRSSCGTNENLKIILTHIPSDRKRSVHEELSEIAKEDSMTVAYDGYFFSI